MHRGEERNHLRSTKARVRLNEYLPPLLHERRGRRGSYVVRDLRGAPVGPSNRARARSVGGDRPHLARRHARVIHADDEERGAARPPERVLRIHHENDAAGYNRGLRGCYSMPPRATEEDVSASFSASSSSSSSWRRRDPTRWRKASSGKMLRVLAEGQILTKRGQHRR